MLRRALIPLLLLAVVGCARSRSAYDGPLEPARARAESWDFQGQAARKLVTPHYVIYTTVSDDELLGGVGQLMEGALTQYRRLAPDVRPSDRPMECYLFERRDQWAAFTRSRTGADAAIYLQINRGGYTVRDWYVAYFIGDAGTYSVAAHEGWHQYVARHFRSRLPPFLEEGLACMFEEVWWESPGAAGRSLPRWSLSRNGSRVAGLKKAFEGAYLLPLSQLASMHAGQVVDQSPQRIEAFYAESWAFARFLWEAEGGRYRPALQKILTDAASGGLYPQDESRRTDDGLWNPDTARPLLEHYLKADLEHVDSAFRRYVHRVVSEVGRGDGGTG